MLFFILGFIFLAVGSFCFALGSIFDYLGAAKDTEVVEYDDVEDDETETTETEESTEE